MIAINTTFKLAKKYFKLISKLIIYFANFFFNLIQKSDYFKFKAKSEKKDQFKDYQKNFQNL